MIRLAILLTLLTALTAGAWTQEMLMGAAYERRGAVAAVPFSFLGIDRSTGGSWVGVYGADGYSLLAFNNDSSDLTSLPSYIQSISLSGGARYAYEPQGTGKPSRLVQNPTNTTLRAAAVYYSYPTTTILVSNSVAKSYTMRFYYLDYDTNARSNGVIVTVNSVSITNNVGSFNAGAWQSWRIVTTAPATTTIKISQLAGTYDLISGIFFDP